jgi:hypothetical protein
VSQQIPKQSPRIRIFLWEYLSCPHRILTEVNFACENLDIVWPIDKVDEVNMRFLYCLASDRPVLVIVLE